MTPALIDTFSLGIPRDLGLHFSDIQPKSSDGRLIVSLIKICIGSGLADLIIHYTASFFARTPSFGTVREHVYKCKSLEEGIIHKDKAIIKQTGVLNLLHDPQSVSMADFLDQFRDRI